MSDNLDVRSKENLLLPGSGQLEDGHTSLHGKVALCMLQLCLPSYQGPPGEKNSELAPRVRSRIIEGARSWRVGSDYYGRSQANPLLDVAKWGTIESTGPRASC